MPERLLSRGRSGDVLTSSDGSLLSGHTIALVEVFARPRRRMPRRVRIAVDWAATIVVAVGFVLAFEAEIARPYQIPSSSMEPTLHCARPALGCEASFSDRVIACELCYRFSSPERGQVVVFHAPAAAAAKCGEAGVYVKRLIGLPGDTIREDARAFLSVDGKPLDEPYVSAAARSADTQFRNRVWHVPAGSYFMMGDNRGESCDSRLWGDVPRSSLIGPVVATYWPPSRLSLDS
jgi:signal peptidase I